MRGVHECRDSRCEGVCEHGAVGKQISSGRVGVVAHRRSEEEVVKGWQDFAVDLQT